MSGLLFSANLRFAINKHSDVFISIQGPWSEVLLELDHCFSHAPKWLWLGDLSDTMSFCLISHDPSLAYGLCYYQGTTRSLQKAVPVLSGPEMMFSSYAGQVFFQRCSWKMTVSAVSGGDFLLQNFRHIDNYHHVNYSFLRTNFLILKRIFLIVKQISTHQTKATGPMNKL
jgi:hypothetical protein